MSAVQIYMTLIFQAFIHVAIFVFSVLISIENKTCYDFTLVCQALILPERFPQKISVIFNCSLDCDATGMTPLICGISST